jgi:hypothetical protein
MAVKFLTTKKHSKIANKISKIKEENKPIKELAKLIKEVAKPIDEIAKPIKEVAKPIKEVAKKPIATIKFAKPNLKNMLDKPIKKVVKKPIKRPIFSITKNVTIQEYIQAQLIVKQYEKENPIRRKKTITKANKKQINLYKEISVRVANRICVYFREKGVELDMANFDEVYLKQINLNEIKLMRNFGKRSLFLLEQYLEKQR